MNLLVLGGPGQKQLQLPATFVKEWATHPTFGSQFNEFMTSFHEKYGTALQDTDPENDDPQRKKRKTGSDAGTPIGEKKKLESRVVEASAVVGNKMFEAPLAIKGGGINLSIRAGNKAYLINMSGHEVTIPAHIYVCGLGKGSFKIMKQVPGF